jgi:hypothetical protein
MCCAKQLPAVAILSIEFILNLTDGLKSMSEYTLLATLFFQKLLSGKFL